VATYDLKEIANKYAKKQTQMVDDLTEEAPIVERVKWESASHNLWNMAEKVVDVDGPGFVNANAPLSAMNISSELLKTDLQVLGGYMEVPEDTADQFGDPAAYFGRKMPLLLNNAGVQTERKLYYDNWMAKAIKDDNVLNAGAATGKVYSIMVVRFKAGVNMGLFDPTGFKQGALLTRESINNGALYHLRSLPGVLGYGVRLKGRFGWQNLSNKTVALISNIQESSLPTKMQLDDAIAKVRGSEKNTMIFCHPRAKTMALAPFKESALQMGLQDKDYNRIIDYWNGVPVITSYNIDDGTESVIS
jgi:hypothetical protein